MIGLKKGSITLLTHDPDWGLEAEQTSFRLSKVLGNVAKDTTYWKYRNTLSPSSANH